MSAALIDLGPAVKYTYTLVVSSTQGSATGEPVSFSTGVVAPDAPEIGPSDVTFAGALHVNAKGMLHFTLHNHLPLKLGVVSIVARTATVKTKPTKAALLRATTTAVKKKAAPPLLTAQTLAPTLRASHATVLTARMTRSGWRRLQARGRLRITVTVTLVAPDGYRVALKRTVTLRAPKRHA